MNLLLYEFRKRGLVHSATWKALVSMLNEKKKTGSKDCTDAGGCKVSLWDDRNVSKIRL